MTNWETVSSLATGAGTMVRGVGGQLAISRFPVQRSGPDKRWLAADARHWNVGRRIRASPAARQRRG